MTPRYNIYLDTSVFNHALWSSNPLFKEESCWLFEEINKGRFEAFTSGVTIDEIEKAPTEKRLRLFELVDSYPVEIIKPIDQDHIDLARTYLQKGAIAKGETNDALHIAVASIKGIELIVSLNFQHMVKFKTNIMVSTINAQNNLKAIEIRSPGMIKDEIIRSR
ncbi:MAG: PIN domain-containing protein [Chlamydiae bacterium]|nr:PIN domain-containing protein [Chlamydiota bacterium]MBI3266949.1 PIN domain-containing protein [Chlamydiota bacterium]